MSIWEVIAIAYFVFGLAATLVCNAAFRDIDERHLDVVELVMIYLIWPIFLICFIAEAVEELMKKR